MKTPKRIAPLVEDGLVDEVVRQLMSGKEATIFVVRCGEEIRCAKVYKVASQRSFAFTEAEAIAMHQVLLREVVLMLCAGVIHGDLSEYNILVDSQGPVIIDLPQAVDAAGNNNAAVMLERDVDNLANFFGQFAPALNGTLYGKEIWLHYEAGTLTPELPLTGYVELDQTPVDVDGVLSEVEDVRLEEEARRRRVSENETAHEGWG